MIDEEIVFTPWRAGRRVGRTIYVDQGEPDPNDGSLLIGVMDTPKLAAAVVEAHNVMLYLRRDASGEEEIRALIARHEEAPDACNDQWGGYAICRLGRGHTGNHESMHGQWWRARLDGTARG